MNIILKLSNKLLIIVLFAVNTLVCADNWYGTDEYEVFFSGDLESIKKLVNNNKEQYRHLNEDALFTAIDRGNVEIVRYLTELGWIKQCVQLEQCSQQLITTAVPNGSLETLQFLLNDSGLPFDYYALTTTINRGRMNIITYVCQQQLIPLVHFADWTEQMENLSKYNITHATGGRSRNPIGEARILANTARINRYLEQDDTSGSDSLIIEQDQKF